MTDKKHKNETYENIRYAFVWLIDFMERLDPYVDEPEDIPADIMLLHGHMKQKLDDWVEAMDDWVQAINQNSNLPLPELNLNAFVYSVTILHSLSSLEQTKNISALHSMVRKQVEKAIECGYLPYTFDVLNKRGAPQLLEEMALAESQRASSHYIQANMGSKFIQSVLDPRMSPPER